MSRILCVDDNDNNLFLLNTVLNRAGYDILEARTGEEGVALALAEQPDLVLMDLSLPGIDGFEATRRIRAMPGVGDVPIVALSGHDESDKGKAASEAGCNGYVRKPIEIRALLTTINDLLSDSVPAAQIVAGGVASS